MACDKDAVKTSPSKEKKEENEKKLRPKIALGASYGSPDTAFKVEKNSEIKLFMHTNYSLHPWMQYRVM